MIQSAGRRLLLLVLLRMIQSGAAGLDDPVRGTAAPTACSAPDDPVRGVRSFHWLMLPSCYGHSFLLFPRLSTPGHSMASSPLCCITTASTITSGSSSWLTHCFSMASSSWLLLHITTASSSCLPQCIFTSLSSSWLLYVSVAATSSPLLCCTSALFSRLLPCITPASSTRLFLCFTPAPPSCLLRCVSSASSSSLHHCISSALSFALPPDLTPSLHHLALGLLFPSPLAGTFPWALLPRGW